MKANKTIYTADLEHPMAQALCALSPITNPGYTVIIITHVNGIQKMGPLDTQFSMGLPNPYALEMLTEFPKMKEILGTELAQTIIDYNTNDKVAAILFPNGSLRSLPGYKKMLDKATLKDLDKEMTLRKNLIRSHTSRKIHDVK